MDHKPTIHTWLSGHALNAMIPVQARALITAAAAATMTSEGREESSVMTAPGGSATAEGKPGWLAQSPAWRSAEAQVMEASIVVLKQLLDLQAVQVGSLGIASG